LETYAHSKRVSILAEHLAQFDNLQPSDANRIKIDGASHDIGKRYLPLSVIMKPGKLTQDEKDAINIEGLPWRQKIIVRYVPSTIFVRLVVVALSYIGSVILIKEWLKK